MKKSDKKIIKNCDLNQVAEYLKGKYLNPILLMDSSHRAVVMHDEKENWDENYVPEHNNDWYKTSYYWDERINIKGLTAPGAKVFCRIVNSILQNNYRGTLEY